MSISDFFQLRQRGSTVGRELRGAVATFLTMAYILFVNPSILAAAGVPLHPPIVAPGHLSDPVTRTALIGLLLTAVLVAHRVKGALIIGIIATTAISFHHGVTTWPKEFLRPTFAGVAFHADVLGALKWRLMPLLFAVIMVDFFDTLGTATAVAEAAK